MLNAYSGNSHPVGSARGLEAAFLSITTPHPVLTQTSREALMFVELLHPYAYFRKCPVFLKHLKECRGVHGPPSYPAGGR